MKRPLLQAYPQLQAQLPYIPLAELPTPVEAKPEIAAQLWIKRDDLSNSIYGGNKVRKLEFILPQVKQKNKKALVSFGAIGSHHGVASAIFAQQFNIPLRFFLFEQAVNGHVQNNLKLMHRFGAKLEYCGSLFKTVAKFYWDQLINGRQHYHLFAGGSNLQGCMAFVNAAYELKQQIEQGLLPEPDYIYCPVGSSATLAGLSLGCALAGLSSQVIGVRVAPSHLGPIPACTSRTVSKLQQQSYQFLCQHLPEIKTLKPPKIHLLDEYFGAAYGEATSAGDAAKARFKACNIELESTYTAKAAAAVLEACRQEPQARILYWHTYNSADTQGLAAKVETASMPLALQSFFTEPPSIQR